MLLPPLFLLQEAVELLWELSAGKCAAASAREERDDLTVLGDCEAEAASETKDTADLREFEPLDVVFLEWRRRRITSPLVAGGREPCDSGEEGMLTGSLPSVVDEVPAVFVELAKVDGGCVEAEEMELGLAGCLEDRSLPGVSSHASVMTAPTRNATLPAHFLLVSKEGTMACCSACCASEGAVVALRSSPPDGGRGLRSRGGSSTTAATALPSRGSSLRVLDRMERIRCNGGDSNAKNGAEADRDIEIFIIQSSELSLNGVAMNLDRIARLLVIRPPASQNRSRGALAWAAGAGKLRYRPLN